MHTPTQCNVFKDGDIVWKHGIEIHAKILPHFNATIKYYSHSLKYFERGGVFYAAVPHSALRAQRLN